MKLTVKNPIAAGAVVGLALLGSLAIASPALAVTNPADNPQRIEVKGDDGQTYVDGQDTLPGYDDEECTYIPGAWFDFDNNRVHYADGQSIPWTEWDRTAGYQDWLKKKQASSGSGSTGGSSSGSGSTSGSGSSTKTTTTKSSSGSSGSSKTSSSGGSTSGTSASETTASGSTSDAKKSDGAAKSKDAKDDASAETTGTEVTATGAETTATPEAAEATGAQADDGGPSPLLGVGILGGLAATGGLAWGGFALRRRATGK